MTHLSNYGNYISQDISRNIYVDNLITGVTTVEEEIDYYDETKKIFDEASMNMCQWASNAPQLMGKIRCEDKRVENKIKVLDMIWKLDVDKLYISGVGDFENGEALSKRKMLKAISSIYDPYGKFCPVLIEPEILMQELWKKGLGWDEKVPEEIELQWRKWLKDIHL